MTLEELITALDAADPTLVLPHGFTNPHSYRGYYDELAFEPATNVPVADMLADARSALGATYTGWKGGEFVMRGYTDCWLAQEGSAGGETLGPLLLEFMLAAGIRDAARTASGQQPETTRCACPHPVDEHSVYGCADDCACEWMPKRVARQATGQDDPACVDCEHPKKLHNQRGCNGHWGPEEGCTCPLTNTGRTACKGATVCGDNDEPCDQHEREQAHAEGEHAFCGSECECTCAAAGPEFVPAGHYRDCPQYAEPAPAVGQPAQAQATDEARVEWDGTAADATRVIDWVLAHGGTATYTCQDSAQCPAADGATAHHISIRTADGTVQANPGARITRATTWTVEDER